MEDWNEATERAIYIQTPEGFRKEWEEICDLVWLYPAQLQTDLYDWNLQRVERGTEAFERLARFHLPPTTKDFLADAGLPPHSVFSFHFDDLSTSGFSLQEILQGEEDLPEDLSEYIEIGRYGYGRAVCIEEFTGRVLVVSCFDNEISKVFLNKNILSFAKSILIAFRKIVLEYCDWDYIGKRFGSSRADSEFVAAEECKELIAFFDPDAIDDENAFWRRLLDEFVEEYN